MSALTQKLAVQPLAGCAHFLTRIACDGGRGRSPREVARDGGAAQLDDPRHSVVVVTVSCDFWLPLPAKAASRGIGNATTLPVSAPTRTSST